MEDIQEYRIDHLIALLPFPSEEINKYTRGTLNAVVGSARYPGAACLAASASQRMGAGYTKVFTDTTAVDQVRAYCPSLVVSSWNELTPKSLSSTLPHKPCAYLVGSGIDKNDKQARSLVHTVLKHTNAPVILDGGGIAALSCPKGQSLLLRRFLKGWSTVITPHAGEAARLAHVFDLPTDNPAALSRLLSLAYGVVSVVKGPTTFISDGEGTFRMAAGTPALAKAGTGDVLAGMIGALLAQGMDAVDACVLGSELHARAGKAAAARLSAISTIAEDVIAYIPFAIADLVHNEAPSQPSSKE